MDVRKIAYFLAVCEELNFTRAARRCNVAQPSLSAPLKDLKRNSAVSFSFAALPRSTHPPRSRGETAL